MKIGILKEIKDNEYRVSLTPEGAKKLKKAGAKVFVEKGAGLGSGFSDAEYKKTGAKISGVKQILKECELILKIKEPIGKELKYFKAKHTVFTFFHFASNKNLTKAMMQSGCNCIAYETVTSKKIRTPLLAPMSQVAGRMAPHIGAYYLAKPNQGRGILLQGIEGVDPAQVVILGGGFVGSNAAEVALGMGANVTILQRKGNTFKKLKKRFSKARIIESNPKNIEKEVKKADLLIGAIYIPGAKAKRLVTKKLVAKMKQNSVIVDVAIDQGGSVETSKATTHSNPVYKVNKVTHYCVANMPGAYPITSTLGLTNATLPYILKMVKQGIPKALRNDLGFLQGVNIWQGDLVNHEVARAHNLKSSHLAF